MSDLRIDTPSWIWLALAGVPAAIVAIRAFSSMSLGRRWSAALFRLAVFALLALVLAGLSSVRITNTLAVVAVIDASDSVRRFGTTFDASAKPTDALDRAREFLARATRSRGVDDLVGAVVFDGRALVAATPTRGGLQGREFTASGAQGTNIEQAIDLALSMLPPDAAGRLLLVSDGRQTEGDALRAAAVAAARIGASGRRGVPIDVLPIDYAVTNEVFVEQVDAPPRAAAESTITVRVVLNASAPTLGTIRLLQEGTEIDLDPNSPATRLPIELAAGSNVFVFPVPLGTSRIHRFEARFEPLTDAGDTITANNSAAAFTLSPGRGSVLILDGVSESVLTPAPIPGAGDASTLARSLRESGLNVDVRAPGSAPEDLLALEAFDVVILQNVPADALSLRAQQSLSTYVRELGGGLLMLGGPDSFAGGGWRASELEPLLPVRLDLPDKLVVPEAAVVLVLDNSGSMDRSVLGSTRTQQQIVNQASAMAVRMLDKRDLLGVIVFNNQFNVIVPLSPNTNPDATAAKLLRITSDSGTNMGPAMAEGIRQLAASNAKVKHLIVLSDGKSMNPQSLPDEAARAATIGIRVSSIGVGDDADIPNMRRIAERGGGTFYNVINPTLLPRVFLKAVRVVRSPLYREAAFTPLIPPTASPLVAGTGDAPQLLGLSLTQVRRDAGIINAMLTPEGEPLLAHWNVELGQVAAFTSDAHRWAAPWLSWPGYQRFWAQLIRALSRIDPSRSLEAGIRVDDGALRVTLDAADDSGAALDGLDVPATLYPPDGEPIPVSLSQVGPGRYEATVPATAQGTYVAVVRPARRGVKLTPVLAGAAVASTHEWRHLTSDRALLERIAEATNGRVLDISSPQDAKLFDRAGTTPQEAFTLLWRSLLIAAIIVLLLDIATRRIAWDRWLIREFGADAARERAALDAQARGAARTLDSLRSRREPARQASTTTLSDQDAGRLAAAARDRRSRDRLAAIRAASASQSSTATVRAAPQSQTLPDNSQSSQADNSGGLLAAKRRAARKIDDAKKS
jgi:Ca-activated chloride channel homolog